MRAVVYTSKGPAAEVLKVVDKPLPEPGPGEVRVKVAYSGVNPSDVKSRSGVAARTGGYPEVTPHSDGSGIVDEVVTGRDRHAFGGELHTGREGDVLPDDPVEVFHVVLYRGVDLVHTRLELGDGNVVREFASVHTGTVGGGGVTDRKSVV
mgnify:CR=1 FL=1